MGNCCNYLCLCALGIYYICLTFEPRGNSWTIIEQNIILTVLCFRLYLLPLHLEKAFFSIMQNKTDKGTSLVSKSLAVRNLNSVIDSFSASKTNRYVLCNGMKYPLKYRTLLSSFSTAYRCSNS